jgi:hypothetical protein
MPLMKLNINTTPDSHNDDELDYTEGDLSGNSMDSPTDMFKGLTIGLEDFPTAEQLDAERDKVLAASLEPIQQRKARNERLPISFTSELPKSYGQREMLHLNVVDNEIHYAYRLNLSNSFTTGVINKDMVPAQTFEHFKAAFDASEGESFLLANFLTPDDNQAIFEHITEQVNKKIVSASTELSDSQKSERMPSLEEAIQEQIKYKTQYIMRTSSNAEEIQTDFKNRGKMSIYEGNSMDASNSSVLLDVKEGISFLPPDIEKNIPQRILDSVAYKTVCANLGELEKNWLGANITKVYVSIAETSSGNIEINIKDNGPGMPKKFISDSEGNPYPNYRDVLNALGGGAGVRFLAQAPDEDMILEPHKAYFYFEDQKLMYVTLNNRDNPYEMIPEKKTDDNNSKYTLFTEDMDALKELSLKSDPAGKFSYIDSTFLSMIEKDLVAKLIYRTSENSHTSAAEKIKSITSDKDPTKNRGGAGRGNAGASSALEKAGGSLLVENYQEVINGVAMSGASLTFISPSATQKKLEQGSARNVWDENHSDAEIMLTPPWRSNAISSPTSQFSEGSTISLSPMGSGSDSEMSTLMSPVSMSSDSPSMSSNSSSMSMNSPSRTSDDMSLASPKSPPSLKKNSSDGNLKLFSQRPSSANSFFGRVKSDVPEPPVQGSDINKSKGRK